MAQHSNEVRTLNEIYAKLQELEWNKDDDFFGFKKSDLVTYLLFEQAKPYLKEKVTTDQWTPSKLERESIILEMLDYMEFAWGKANNCRGISSGRSIEHYEIWLWLLKDDLCEELEDMYQYYGKPCLRVICEKYDWDWRKWDDGEWRNFEDGPFIAPPAADCPSVPN